MTELLHDLLLRSPSMEAPALIHKDVIRSYGDVAEESGRFASALLRTGLARGDRVAVYLDKRPETVVAIFGTLIAGGVFVPLNPLLKAEQVRYVIDDCNVRVLVTSSDRAAMLTESLQDRDEPVRMVIVDSDSPDGGTESLSWAEVRRETAVFDGHRVIDSDMAAILYTSGSTGKPKGVVLSHRNIVAGARSVAQYLENTSSDRILSVLPLSFDYGLSQVTTAFHSGASVVLMNYLLPKDVLNEAERHEISGLAAVPPLWIRLAELDWAESIAEHLRYITNSGGKMPLGTLRALRERVPRTRVFLMYGLTEAFRSTYLPPDELDARPESIGKAIPNAEVMVVRPDGSLCAPNEEGELVHRGALVALGYWNDPARTAERFRPAPDRTAGITTPELAVWSGDTVRYDEDGFLYFVTRKDEMIKSSGYRISPTEVEEVIYGTGLVGEAATIGVPHPVLGQAVVVVATAPTDGQLEAGDLIAECRRKLPAYMIPAHVEIRSALARNPNGKIDRKSLADELHSLFADLSS